MQSNIDKETRANYRSTDKERLVTNGDNDDTHLCEETVPLLEVTYETLVQNSHGYPIRFSHFH